MRIRARSITACVLAGTAVYTAALARDNNQADAHAASVAEHASAKNIQVETLLKAASSWDGAAYTHYPDGKPEMTVVRLTIPPRTTLPWHTHPMPNAAYVVSGHIIVEKQADGQTRTLGAGQVLAEMVDTPHRGSTGDEPAVLMVFYAGTPGMPLSVQP